MADWKYFKVKKTVIVIQPATMLVRAGSVIGLPEKWDILFMEIGSKNVIAKFSDVKKFEEYFESWVQEGCA